LIAEIESGALPTTVSAKALTLPLSSPAGATAVDGAHLQRLGGIELAPL
jgi:hypothetical protein